MREKKITRTIESIMVNADIIDRTTKEMEVVTVTLPDDTKNIRNTIEEMFPNKVVVNYDETIIASKYSMPVSKFIMNADTYDDGDIVENEE